MISYDYECQACGFSREVILSSSKLRDEPVEKPCPNCQAMSVIRIIGGAGFTVPEGACGNAANGYSSYHGDSENFKAGRKIYK